MRVVLLAPYAPGVRVEEQGRAGVSKEVPVGGPLSGDSDRLSGEIRESEGNQPPTFEEMMAVIERRRRRDEHEIDRLRERVAELEAAIRSVQSDHRPDGAGGCRVCSPWRCLVWLELDAVLPPEEEQG